MLRPMRIKVMLSNPSLQNRFEHIPFICAACGMESTGRQLKTMYRVKEWDKTDTEPELYCPQCVSTDVHVRRTN